jgi:hypothetical protein
MMGILLTWWLVPPEINRKEITYCNRTAFFSGIGTRFFYRFKYKVIHSEGNCENSQVENYFLNLKYEPTTNCGAVRQIFLTAVPADLNSEEALHFKKTLLSFPEEAVYIYSFKESRMIYADGWESILGYRDDEIDMLKIISITTQEYAPFSYELNDKALIFIQSKREG